MTREKPCEYAEDLGGDCWECIAYYAGVGCGNAKLDLNPDGSVNIACCSLGENKAESEDKE